MSEETSGQTVTGRLLTFPVRRGKRAGVPDAAVPSRQLVSDQRALRDLFSEGKLLRPAYPLRALASTLRTSSILGPLVTAMAVNIDGFGYDFTYVGPKGQDQGAEAQAELGMLRAWFGSCHPYETYELLRDKFRRDIETVGRAGLEVMRAPKTGIPQQLEHLPGVTLYQSPRDPRPTLIKLPFRAADGKIEEREVWYRFRRFAQLVDRHVVWFREFGDPRILDWRTGEYASDALDEQYRATEILFDCLYDPTTDGGVPRWIGALLTLEGMREAQVVNFLFFKKNAIPALAVLVSGGKLTKQTLEFLQDFMNGEAGGGRGTDAVHRVLLLEALPGDGKEPAQGQVKIEFKPLQSERQNDAMFREYTKDGRIEVRSTFRLPPLYIGEIEAQNFATAMASRLTAEEQVFVPERSRTDALFNRRLLPTLPATFWEIWTKGPEISDMEQVTAALDACSRNGGLSVNAVIEIANEILGLKMPLRTEKWADFPFRLVETVATQGRLAELDEILDPNARPLDAGLEEPVRALRRRAAIADVVRDLRATLASAAREPEAGPVVTALRGDLERQLAAFERVVGV